LPNCLRADARIVVKDPTEPATSLLETLPSDMMRLVLHYLDPVDYGKLGRVSKCLRQWITKVGDESISTKFEVVLAITASSVATILVILWVQKKL
jgi:hypothetical protein